VLLLSASGTTTLEDIRENEQASNAQRAFDVVADNMVSIYQRNSPSRATEIDLGESQLFYGDKTSIEVQVDGSVVEQNFELRPIVLRTDENTELVYEGGAVFQTEREGGTMLRTPPFLFSGDRVQVPVIQTTAPTVEAVSGTTALLRGKSTNRSALLSEAESGTDYSVTVTISSPRYEIWQRYFEEETYLTDCSTTPSTETVECTTTSSSRPEAVYVTRQEIELSILL